MRLPPKSPSGAGVSEKVCMLILYLSAQTSYTWLFSPAPSTSLPFTFRSQITSSRSHLFPFLLLILSLLEQYSHFNTNSVDAYPPLNPPHSFCAAVAQIPEKLIRENMRVFMRPAMQYVRCYLVKCNTFSFMGCTNFLFSTVCASYIPFMMHDRAYNSPSPLQHTASNQSCPKVMAVTTGIIIHFFFLYSCLSVFLSMPAWNLSLSRCVRV